MGVTIRGFLDINTREDKVLQCTRSQKFFDMKTNENFVQWRNYGNCYCLNTEKNHIQGRWWENEMVRGRSAQQYLRGEKLAKGVLGKILPIIPPTQPVL